MAVGEERQRALGELLRLVGAQRGGVEAGAREQRHHVDEHLAGGADLAREAIAPAQQASLAVGAAVRPLREDEGDAPVAGQVGGDGLDVGVVGERVVDRRVAIDETDRVRRAARELHASDRARRAHACTAVARRTAFAATLNGSMPTRRTVAMKRSSLLARSVRYVSITASMTSGTSSAANDGPITLPVVDGPLSVEPSAPPSETWYHSWPSLSTPRMPMWPLWWWPHELMQPLMCRSMSPMSYSSSRSAKRSAMAA